MRASHRRRRPAVLPVALVLAAVVVAGCSPSDAQPRPGERTVGGTTEGQNPPPDRPAVALATDSSRESDAVIAAGGADAPYNYAPAVMRDEGRTRMWWCSQYGAAPPAGDDILHAEAADIEEPFTGPDGAAPVPVPVLSGNPGGFDGVHTCDPSVIRVNGTYYMYYTGAAGDHALGNSIGLATSTDGISWARANGGEPVVDPAHDTHRDNTYGAGQPAAVHLDGWFYLMFTDTTGREAGWNGAGQFVVRAKDPAFTTEVQALKADGFRPAPGTGAPRTDSLVDAFSADLMWVDALDAFAIAHETRDGTTLTFWDREFTANPFEPVIIPGPWREGPGLLREPEGHARISTRDPCDRVPVDVVRATVTGAAGAPTDLRHYGIDLQGVGACTDPARTLRVLDGVAMPSPVRTMDVVVEGKVVRVDRRSVAEALAGRVLDRRLPVLDTFPVATRLRAGAPALRAPGSGTGLLLDDGALWPIASDEIAELNDSALEAVDDQRWNAYPVGPVLGP
ncbi:beta-xylosidase [Amycolatopsis antarctica]|uniref:Beta-xylosidase n=1 Tax=Amycolatopsis antarctica TaxID=1854586 RepID=A0A263D3G4_9PSEU|nr:beta-xylosidase [Amycolatopsis antarctica]OZM73012.1 beta-xylosidase [Amycolatopsis antarctica]